MKKLLAMTALSAALFFGQTAAAEEKSGRGSKTVPCGNGPRS